MPEDYRPTFNNTTRTIIYIIALIAQVVALGFLTFGDSTVSAFISASAGIIAAGFGVAYNPNRMSSKS